VADQNQWRPSKRITARPRRFKAWSVRHADRRPVNATPTVVQANGHLTSIDNAFN
jgi:hypothetical protein